MDFSISGLGTARGVLVDAPPPFCRHWYPPRALGEQVSVQIINRIVDWKGPRANLMVQKWDDQNMFFTLECTDGIWRIVTDCHMRLFYIREWKPAADVTLDEHQSAQAVLGALRQLNHQHFFARGRRLAV